ncbi:MAG: hypothetical protein ACTMIE_15460, partial [Cellulosimicrobium funkei]
YLYAAQLLDVPAAEAVVVEDALSGVQAGAAGGFGLVLGVDRGVGADALLAHGADVVVADLGALDATVLDRPRAATADAVRPAVTAPADEEAGA